MSWPRKKQRRAVPILIVGTIVAKNDIHSWMQKDDHGKGFMHHPRNCDYSWFQQMTSEKPIDQRDKYGRKKRFWVKKTSGARNEALDMFVYAYAALSYINPDWSALTLEMKKLADGTYVAPKPRRRTSNKRKKND